MYPPTVPFLSHLDPVHTLSSHCWKTHLNIILPSTPRSYKQSISLRFPHQNPVCTSPFPLRATCPAYLVLDFITRTILSEEYRSLSSSLCSFLDSPVTSSLIGPNILLSTLFSHPLNLHSSLSASYQVSHPCKTTDKSIFLYILIFLFLGSKLNYKGFCTER